MNDIQKRLSEYKNCTRFMNAHDIVVAVNSVRNNYVLKDELWYLVKTVELVDRNNVRLGLHTGDKLIVTAFRSYEFCPMAPKSKIAPEKKLTFYFGTDTPKDILETMRNYVHPDRMIAIQDDRFADKMHLRCGDTVSVDPLSFGISEYVKDIKVDTAYDEGSAAKIKGLVCRCKRIHTATAELMAEADYEEKHWKPM